MKFQEKQTRTIKVIHFSGMKSTKYGGFEKWLLALGNVVTENGGSFIVYYNEEPQSQSFIEDAKKNGIQIRGEKVSFLKLLQIILTEHPDIVHFHFGPICNYAPFITWLLGVKTRYRTIHSMMFPSNRISIKAKIKHTLINQFLTNQFCISEGVYNQFLKAILNKNETNKIKVNYLGVPVYQKEDLEHDDKSITISCVAFHDDVKGIDILIKALHILKTRYLYNSFKLIQIGGESLDSPYVHQASSLNLESNVCWVGITDNVRDYLKKSDIYCQPSRSEGLSLSLLEAAELSLPLIGSNIGGIPEIILDGRNGYLFEVGDYETLAEKLFTLFKNSACRKSFGQQSRKIIEEKYNISKNVFSFYSEYYCH